MTLDAPDPPPAGGAVDEAAPDRDEAPQAQRTEALVRVIEDAPRVFRRSHFFVWTQASLQRLLPHSRAICGAYQRDGRHLAFEVFHNQPQPQTVTDRVLAQVVQGGVDLQLDHPVLTFEAVPVDSDQPVAAFHVAAGCLFAPGRIVQELPYDPFLYFHGEEQSMALRAWTRGWDLWHDIQDSAGSIDPAGNHGPARRRAA